MVTEVNANGVYTLREACEFLRISEATARRWTKAGLLRGRKIGRAYRFLGSDLLAALTAAGPPPETPFIKPFGPGHPFLELAGIGRSGYEDIAEEHDRHLAAIADERRRG